MDNPNDYTKTVTRIADFMARTAMRRITYEDVSGEIMFDFSHDVQDSLVTNKELNDMTTQVMDILKNARISLEGK